MEALIMIPSIRKQGVLNLVINLFSLQIIAIAAVVLVTLSSGGCKKAENEKAGAAEGAATSSTAGASEPTVATMDLSNFDPSGVWTIEHGNDILATVKYTNPASQEQTEATKTVDGNDFDAFNEMDNNGPFNISAEATINYDKENLKVTITGNTSSFNVESAELNTLFLMAVKTTIIENRKPMQEQPSCLSTIIQANTYVFDRDSESMTAAIIVNMSLQADAADPAACARMLADSKQKLLAGEPMNNILEGLSNNNLIDMDKMENITEVQFILPVSGLKTASAIN